MEMKKLLAIGVIFLFIGVAVAPSINSTGYQTIIVSDNQPPNNPEITGPSKGKVGIMYLFTIVTKDPENQNVSYYIEWGDGTHTGWTPYSKSGQYVHYTHTWYRINEYPVRCKAKDIYNAESNWTYIAMPITINSGIVQSTNNDLVEVTSQACGIQGFGNTTVKLTKQQYNDLEQYLVDFRAGLNQTTTREEAVPLFKDAVVELNKYGLLPKGMSVRAVQGLIVNRFQFVQQFAEPDDNKNHVSSDVKENRNCLITGKTGNTCYESGMQRFVEKILENLPPQLYSIYFDVMLVLASIFLSWINPIAFTYRIYLGTVLEDGEIHHPISFDPATGWIETRGSNGTVNYNGTMYGYLPYKRAIGWSLGFYENWALGGVEGFTGIKLLLPRWYSFYIGSALRVSIGTEPPDWS
jgi:hypothetical protein